MNRYFIFIRIVLASCLLGSLGGEVLPVFAQADELMEPSLPRQERSPTTRKTEQLQELLRQGLQYVETGDYANAVVRQISVG
jgi:hypothetical protein